MTPVLWGRASSVNVQKVMWVLEECDIAHRRVDAGGKYGETDTPEYRAMNPLQLVPVWQEEGLTLWESHAIVRHLARGPASALWPETRSDQALADQWIDFTATTLLPPLIGCFFQTVRLPLADRSSGALAKHVQKLDTAMEILDTRLGRSQWLAGPEFSIADVIAGSGMYRYFTMDIPRPEHAALADWYGRLADRPAYRNTVMTSYEELRSA